MQSSQNLFQWRWYHTALFLVIRVFADSLVRSVRVFDYALSNRLDIDISAFSPIIICYYIGSLSSVFIGTLNEKYISNSKTIFALYLFIAGIASILFGLPFTISQFIENTNITFTICYLTLIWFFYGLSFAISNLIEINIATEYTHESKHAEIISLLSTSWTITSLFYIVQGYIIEFMPGLMYISVGTLLCTLPTIMMNTCFKLDNYDTVASDIDENTQQVIDGAPSDYFLLRWRWLKANKQCSLIFISTFVVALSSGSSDVIVNPVLMDIYRLSTSESGYASLSMAVGEIFASMVLTKFGESWGNYIMVTIATISKLFVAVFIGYMCLNTSSDLDSLGGGDNGIWYFISLIGLWYFGWEMFYVTQIFSIFKYVETHKNTSKRMLLLTLNLCSAIGRICGTIASTLLWDSFNNKRVGLVYIAAFWIVSNVIGGLVYIILYLRDKRLAQIENDDPDQDDSNDEATSLI